MTAEPESTVETFIVEDGIDASLDVEVKILDAAPLNCRIVHLRAVGPPDSGIAMDVEMLRRIVVEIDKRTPPAEPVNPNLARHPIGPDVAAGDRVKVLSQAGGRLFAIGWHGEVLAPGYQIASLSEKSEPAMRVIAVRLPSGQVVDVTGWEKS